MAERKLAPGQVWKYEHDGKGNVFLAVVLFHTDLQCSFWFCGVFLDGHMGHEIHMYTPEEIKKMEFIGHILELFPNKEN